MNQTLSKPKNVEQLDAKAGCSAPSCSVLPVPFYNDEWVTLYNGDALEILPKIGKVSAIITDPPYGVREDEEWDNLTANEFARFSMHWLAASRPLTRELAVFCTSDSVVRDICKMMWPRVRVCIWDKPTGSQYTGASERGMWFAHETILHCYEPTMEKAMDVGEAIKQAREKVGMSRGAVDMALRGKKTGLCFRWEEGACLPSSDQVKKLKEILPLNGELDGMLAVAYGRKNDSPAESRDVLSHRTVTGAVHSCQKPVGLMQELIQRLTNPGDLIADPFAGSGSTLVAAKELGRRAIGIEQDPKHCATIAARLAQDVFQFHTQNTTMSCTAPKEDT